MRRDSNGATRPPPARSEPLWILPRGRKLILRRSNEPEGGVRMHCSHCVGVAFPPLVFFAHMKYQKYKKENSSNHLGNMFLRRRLRHGQCWDVCCRSGLVLVLQNLLAVVPAGKWRWSRAWWEFAFPSWLLNRGPGRTNAASNDTSHDGSSPQCRVGSRSIRLGT